MVKNEVLVNCTPIDFDAIKFVGDISLITLNWNNEYVNNSILDGEECRVKLVQDDKERIIKCKNAFPLNYGEFKETINKVVELWN